MSRRDARRSSGLVLAALLYGGVLAASVSAASAASADLEREVRALLQNKVLSGATVGVQVSSLGSGETLLALHASTPLTPASNTKLVTAAAAIALLGADYVFTTAVGYRGRMQDGRLDGDLVVIGGGDPSFRDDLCEGDGWKPLRDLAVQLEQTGLREVSGDLVLDDALFDREFTAPTWPPDQLNRDYCAPVAALSLRCNCLTIEVSPPAAAGAVARSRIVPELDGFRVQSEITGSAIKGLNEIVLLLPDVTGRVLAKGKTWIGNPVQSFLVPVTNPPSLCGAALAQLLSEHQIQLGGRVRLAGDGELGQPCTMLAQVTSPIEPAIVKMNKDSDNNIAEHLFKLIGARRHRRGTFATAAEAVAEFLGSLGLQDGQHRFVDGSGLSRDNRISAAALTALLVRTYGAPARDLFVRSLPIAGIDGSLKNRMGEEPVCGRVRAKTGFINGVSALSGYVRTVDGESLAFAILMNNVQASNTAMKEVQDSICRLLVRYPSPGRESLGG